MIIFVENLQFEGKHGVYEEERQEGRSFRADVRATLEETRSQTSDDIDDTLDYRSLARAVLEVAQGPSKFLVEKMAREIADLIFERHTQVVELDITLRKHAPDVEGSPEWVGVQLSMENPNHVL